MKSRFFSEAPPVFFVIASSCFLAILLSRGGFRLEGPPAFAYQKQEHVFVELRGDGLDFGVRQINDESDVFDAIKMTGGLHENFYLDPDLPDSPFASGQIISVIKKGRQISLLHDGWISSGQRIALGISLHPDRMEREDWVALPGIGEVLADRIEMNRQKNGEFGSLDVLTRVKGIGKKSIEKWRPFF